MYPESARRTEIAFFIILLVGSSIKSILAEIEKKAKQGFAYMDERQEITGW